MLKLRFNISVKLIYLIYFLLLFLGNRKYVTKIKIQIQDLTILV
jgi:hypothetical protein